MCDDNNRFSQILAEIEHIEHACPNCGLPRVKKRVRLGLSPEGEGLYLYCKKCKNYSACGEDQ